MTIRRSYKKKDLYKCVEENEIELIGEYENVNRDTRIKGKCKTEDCESFFDKNFRYLIENGGPYCVKCINKNNRKHKYDIHLLNKIVNDNRIELIGDYDNVNCHTTIEGWCLSDKCDNKFKKKFIEFVNTKGYCYPCSMKNSGRGTIFNIDLLNEYVDEHKLILSNEYTSTNRDTNIEGICLTNECNGLFSKTFRQIIEASGPYCKKCTNINTDTKCKSTNLERRGVEYSTQSKDVLELMESNCISKYGVKNISQLDVIKDKKNKTRLKNYGCKSCGLFCVYNIQRTNNDKEYDLCDYCQPMKTNKLYEKTKEMLVVRKLREDLPDVPFIHNKSLGSDCTRNDRENTNGHIYPDILIYLEDFNLIVEVDEFAHRYGNYTCDMQRMYDIVAKSMCPCVIIRYNPDDKKSNYNTLLLMIKYYLQRDISDIDFEEDINDDKNLGLKIEYLFY